MISSLFYFTEDTVTQSTGDVMGYEGGSVALSCNFTLSSSTVSYTLFWYVQRPNDPPQYMLKKNSFDSGVHVSEELHGRFSANLNTSMKTVPLTIEDVQLCDSAVYYCALRPTATVTL
uniref:Ig-like domain-containing protein n=1 Tax=Scleropages formosus TaxID=113540 RepID=A0A8C9TQ62_SCLFO